MFVARFYNVSSRCKLEVAYGRYKSETYIQGDLRKMHFGTGAGK